MSGNVIYRGPIDSQPRTLSSRLVAGAYLPGTVVTDDGTNLNQTGAAADAEAKLYLLGVRDFFGQGQDVTTAPADTPYASGDTGVAYEIAPNEVYQARLAAATYAKGDALTLGASGRLAAAASGEMVVAYFDDTPGAFAAGDLADVQIANAYKLA